MSYLEKASTRYSQSQLDILTKHYEDNNKLPPSLDFCRKLAEKLNDRNEGKPNLTGSKLLNRFWSTHHETRDVSQNHIDRRCSESGDSKKRWSVKTKLGLKKKVQAGILSEVELDSMFEKYSIGSLKLDDSDGIIIGANRSHKFSDFDVIVLKFYYKELNKPLLKPPSKACCKIIAEQLNSYSKPLNLIRNHSSDTILNWFYRIHNINRDVQNMSTADKVNLPKEYKSQLGSSCRFSQNQINYLDKQFHDKNKCFPGLKKLQFVVNKVNTIDGKIATVENVRRFVYRKRDDRRIENPEKNVKFSDPQRSLLIKQFRVNAYPTQDGRCKLASRLNSIPGRENISGSVVGSWFNMHHQLHEKLKNDELSCRECHKPDGVTKVNLASQGKRFTKNQIICLKNEFLKNPSPLNINHKRIVAKVNKIPGKKATVENVRSWFTGNVQKQNNAKFLKDKNKHDEKLSQKYQRIDAVGEKEANTSVRSVVKKEADWQDSEAPEITPDSDNDRIDMKEDNEIASMSNFSACVRPGSKRGHSFIKEEYVTDSEQDTLHTVEVSEPESELESWCFKTE